VGHVEHGLLEQQEHFVNDVSARIDYVVLLVYTQQGLVQVTR
jgi:hypothetical protein